MKSRRGGWLQDRGRPKGRSLDSNHRNGLGPGGSGSKLEHPRFPVNVLHTEHTVPVCICIRIIWYLGRL